MAATKKTATKKTTKKTAGAIKAPAVVVNTDETVTVCMNYPQSIRFRLRDNAGKEYFVRINGNGESLRGKRTGELPVGAFGLTFGVAKSDWDKIKEQVKEWDLYKMGNLYASTPSQATDSTTERKDLRNGLEPIDTSKTVTQQGEL